MLKASSSAPQLYFGPKAASPVNPASLTVSKIDQAICDRVQSRSGSNIHRQTLSPSPHATRSATAQVDDKGDRKLSREIMRETIRAKRNEIKTEQERLSSSLTTALCKSEEAILQNRKWMEEVKDLNGSFGKIPPITSNKKVSVRGQSFYVEMN